MGGTQDGWNHRDVLYTFIYIWFLKNWIQRECGKIYRILKEYFWYCYRWQRKEEVKCGWQEGIPIVTWRPELWSSTIKIIDWVLCKMFTRLWPDFLKWQCWEVGSSCWEQVHPGSVGRGDLLGDIVTLARPRAFKCTTETADSSLARTFLFVFADPPVDTFDQHTQK